MNRHTHPSERSLSLDGLFNASACRSIELHTRCYCFSSSSSSSKATQTSSSVTGASATGAAAATGGDLSTVQTGGQRNEGDGMQVGSQSPGSVAASAGSGTVQTGGVRNESDGSVLALKDSKLVTGAEVSLGTGNSTGAVTINAGMQNDALKDLVGSLTKASENQLSEIAQSGNEQLTTLANLLSQQKDAAAGNPKTLAYVAAASIGAVVLLVLFSKR